MKQVYGWKFTTVRQVRSVWLKNAFPVRIRASLPSTLVLFQYLTKNILAKGVQGCWHARVMTSFLFLLGHVVYRNGSNPRTPPVCHLAWGNYNLYRAQTRPVCLAFMKYLTINQSHFRYKYIHWKRFAGHRIWICVSGMWSPHLADRSTKVPRGMIALKGAYTPEWQLHYSTSCTQIWHCLKLIGASLFTVMWAAV